MSFDVRLVCPEEGCVCPLCNGQPFIHHARQGMYALGGTRDYILNITYNYTAHFQQVLGEQGIRILDGRTGAGTLRMLTDAINRLADEGPVDDYWAPSASNARAALQSCLEIAKASPQGVWEVN